VRNGAEPALVPHVTGAADASARSRLSDLRSAQPLASTLKLVVAMIRVRPRVWPGDLPSVTDQVVLSAVCPGDLDELTDGREQLLLIEWFS